jgi:hypothetical protein
MKTLMIKDLSASKELDCQAMSSVRGGFQDSVQANLSGGAYAAGSNGGIGNMTLAVAAPSQLNFNAPSMVNQPVAVGIAGNALAI